MLPGPDVFFLTSLPSTRARQLIEPCDAPTRVAVTETSTGVWTSAVNRQGSVTFSTLLGRSPSFVRERISAGPSPLTSYVTVSVRLGPVGRPVGSPGTSGKFVGRPGRSGASVGRLSKGLVASEARSATLRMASTLA